MWMVQNWRWSIHGSGDHGGGLAGMMGEVLAFLETLVSQSPGEIAATLLPGLAQLDNWHPLAVHFPIALLTTFFVLDLLGSLFHAETWRRGADWFLYCGTLGAIITVLLGFQAESRVAHGEAVHDIMERHETFGITVLSLSVILSAWRMLARGQIQGGANVFYHLLAGVMLIALIFGADLGGHMVYQHGIAVDAVPPPADSATHQHGGMMPNHDHDHAHDHPHDDHHDHDHAHTHDHEHSHVPHSHEPTQAP